MKWKENKQAIIFTSIMSVITLITLYLILGLNVLPMKYSIPVIILLIVICGVLIYTQIKNKGKKLGKVLIFLVSILLLFGDYAMYKGNGTLRKISNQKDGYAIVSVIVKSDNEAENLKGLKGQRLGYSDTGETTYVYRALSDVKKEISDDVSLISYKSMNTFSEDFYENKVDALLLDESTRATIEDEHPDFSRKTKVIAQFEYKIEEEDLSKNVKVTSVPFNVYITGIDTYGEISTTGRSDVNMIATINPKTKQILLTSIPRDYYIEQTCQGNQKDKLTHTGFFGVGCTLTSVENFFDIELNYYARVNFSSLEKIVNALGGITVSNPHDFNAGGFHFEEGDIQLNGAQALAFSRERYSFVDGDFERGRDQMRVLTAIINKITSPAIITNYSSVLDAIADTFQTNMNEDEIKAIINMQLDDMAGWNIKQISVSGTGGSDWTPANGFNAYVAYPNMDSVHEAVEMMRKIEKNEIIE
ncbi:LCP family protein [Absiella sp. AM29-15]|uniref:LCP family glycopolymer transferase n=1 Tax=Absiella sp. AM29-15 TaxID=2292278 RepID=UPI000E427919|nr:LCP family protein [Absiella sp. AM29-15]RGC49197.1 LytR family transcriptional regulator [Absiella sp. AM29-15]